MWVFNYTPEINTCSQFRLVMFSGHEAKLTQSYNYVSKEA